MNWEKAAFGKDAFQRWASIQSISAKNKYLCTCVLMGHSSPWLSSGRCWSLNTAPELTLLGVKWLSIVSAAAVAWRPLMVLHRQGLALGSGRDLVFKWGLQSGKDYFCQRSFKSPLTPPLWTKSTIQQSLTSPYHQAFKHFSLAVSFLCLVIAFPMNDKSAPGPSIRYLDKELFRVASWPWQRL